MIVACSSPFKLTPRLARQRRIAESKRMETFREIHDALKKTAKDDIEMFKGFLKIDEEVEEKNV